MMLFSGASSRIITSVFMLSTCAEAFGNQRHCCCFNVEPDLRLLLLPVLLTVRMTSSRSAGEALTDAPSLHKAERKQLISSSSYRPPFSQFPAEQEMKAEQLCSDSDTAL
ncbi:hypothetical protein AMECASPLE_012849 [Ameca splendens]|uniref:Secreted protein n=1 Tax=Ameca splendens TaxID=208324 RepID=A0ABV0XE97_9TELE